MSQSAPQTSADVYNTYQTSTQVGEIGLTGQAAVDALGVLTAAGRSVAQAGFTLVSDINDRAATQTERIALNQASTLSGLINATQDFSQRAIAGSTGQPTPVQDIGPAADATQGRNTLLIAAVAVMVVLLIKK